MKSDVRCAAIIVCGAVVGIALGSFYGPKAIVALAAIVPTIAAV